MNYNEFEINSFTTNDIDAIPITPGYINLDVNCEKPWQDTLAHIIAHDNTYNKDLTQNDILYIPDEPGIAVPYEDIDRTKYYWDTAHQELYFYDIKDTDDPWYVPYGTYIETDGLPPMVVNTHIEFNPNALYFDGTTEYADIYAWSDERDWYIVDRVMNIPGDPHTDFEYDIDTLDKTIKYYDQTNGIMYAFDYGVYFQKISYTGTIYEKQFEFYKRLHDNFIDVNTTGRYNHKNYIYVGGLPSKKVTSPEVGKVYFDTLKNKMYSWDGTSWTEITQDNIVIPHKIFY